MPLTASDTLGLGNVSLGKPESCPVHFPLNINILGNMPYRVVFTMLQPNNVYVPVFGLWVPFMPMDRPGLGLGLGSS